MSENPRSNFEKTGLCGHGNSAENCEICCEENIEKTHPVERYDITLARKIEGGNFEKYRSNERLTEEEAIIYQDYATKKDKIKFSERASEEANAEAQKLIDNLREDKENNK